MSITIRLPNINGATEAEQLSQIRSYIYQFAEQLQWALNTLENGTESQDIVMKNSAGQVVEKTDERKAQETFNSIKDLIIKSADIVEAYSEEIDKLLDLKGNYVAISDFGTYTAETNQKWSANSEYLEGKFTKTETIDGELVKTEFDLDDIDSRIRKQEGSMRVGLVSTALTEDAETYGIEIGEIDTFNDVVKKRFATFSAAGVELYDGSTDTKPVAYISKSKLYITSAEFVSSVKMGGYRLDFSRGIAFKWEGGLTNGNN